MGWQCRFFETSLHGWSDKILGLESEQSSDQPTPATRPKVIADGPLDQTVMDLMGGQLELLPWQIAIDGSSEPVDGIYTTAAFSLTA